MSAFFCRHCVGPEICSPDNEPLGSSASGIGSDLPACPADSMPIQLSCRDAAIGQLLTEGMACALAQDSSSLRMLTEGL
jgi:NifU-like protein involved in Fe-S cluster formation